MYDTTTMPNFFRFLNSKIKSTGKHYRCKREKQLTIIMPFLNEGEEPTKTITSIYDTAPSEYIRILAIDDASNEPSSHFTEFDDVIHIRNEKRMGLDRCRYVGALMAETPYIFIIDAHMRFKKDDWCLKLIEALEKEPESAFCTTCVGLNEDCMDVHKPKGKYYGANLVLVDEKAKMDRPGRWILEPKWARKKNKIVYEIPCILGANYAFSNAWFRKIRGLDGLQMWGTSEPFMSLKTWLAGGKCKIITDIEIGHRFRHHAPYSTEVHHLVYNKLFVCKTLLPVELSEKLIGYLPKDKAFYRAMQLIEKNQKFVNESRSYYQRLFKASIYEYCQRFDITIPN